MYCHSLVSALTSFTSRAVRRRVPSLALLLLPLAACQSEAQSRSPQGTRVSAGARPWDTYRLTPATVRTVSAVMSEWESTVPPGQRGGSLIGKVQRGPEEIDRIPALKAAIGRAGLSSRDFHTALIAYMQARDYISDEASGASGEKRVYAPLGPGSRKDNVELVRRMSRSETLWEP